MKLLESIKVKDVEFKNRVVMAPMVVFGFRNENGVMCDEIQRHYLERARTGIGLIICQALSVTGRKTVNSEAGAYSDKHSGYLKKIADTCHVNGTRFFAQLAYPVYSCSEGGNINDLSEEDMDHIRNEFIAAARICKKAGCDGVELHGAHGFFLNMVASPLSNRRTDKYGGDTEKRLYLVKKIVDGIKEFTDNNFIISYRLGWNDNLELDIETARRLESMGVEMLHVSSGIPAYRKLELPGDYRYNEIVYTGTQIKLNVTIPVIAVNNIQSLARGNYLLENSLCDFVAYGKPFLADENFINKSLENTNYKSCLECINCQWFNNGKKCPARVNKR